VPQHYRAVVCKFFLKGNCLMGDKCAFLHKWDKSKLPICDEFKKFGSCKDGDDCPYKHELENKSECNMFRLGFCVYGDRCRFHHTHFPGPPPDPATIEAAKPKQFRRKGD